MGLFQRTKNSLLSRIGSGNVISVISISIEISIEISFYIHKVSEKKMGFICVTRVVFIVWRRLLKSVQYWYTYTKGYTYTYTYFDWLIDTLLYWYILDWSSSQSNLPPHVLRSVVLVVFISKVNNLYASNKKAKRSSAKNSRRMKEMTAIPPVPS